MVSDSTLPEGTFAGAFGECIYIGETMLPILVPIVLFVACIAGMLFIKD